MAFGTRIAVEALRSVAFGSVTSSYAALGDPTSDAIRLVAFNNGTNQNILVSLDGVTNHFRIVGNGFKLLDLTTNRVRDDGLFIAKGTTFYIKDEGSSPSSGSFWIEAIYSQGGY